MKKSTVITLSVFGILALLVVGAISTMNGFVKSEQHVKAFNKDSVNVLSNYTMKLQEAAQVPEMYINDLSKIVNETFNGRYGENGSKAVMQWIQERNLNVDSTLYKEIQVIVKAGRDEFRISQTKKIDACAAYETDLRTFPGNIIAGITGYPKIDLDDTCKVISDARTDDAFRTGQQSAIKIRG